MMKRWRVRILWLAVCVLVAVGGAYAWARRAAKLTQQREASYQAALRGYSEVLRPGMTRKNVEGYLRARRKPILRMCCMEGNSTRSNADDVLTKIGEEPAPWFCSE